MIFLIALVTFVSIYAQQYLKPKTLTYKKVNDLEIMAEVYRPDDEKKRPVLVWIHGGALINGHRQGVSDMIKQAASEDGFVLVSLDYRLAPETQLPDIIEDIEDAFTWIHEKGPELFQADTSCVIVTGSSAGGYLSFTAGFRANPRPTALVAFWGYGDLVGDWYSKPSKHKRHQVEIDGAKAFLQVSGPPISDSRERNGNGGQFYQYCRKKGIWPQQVSGWNPLTEAEKFHPYMALKNVDAEYPPTLMVHGTKDTDVPCEQSVMMASEFKKHGIIHKLITIEGGEHGLHDGDPDVIRDAYKQVREFIKSYAK
jgi:acetyl esterase/lipase